MEWVKCGQQARHDVPIGRDGELSIVKCERVGEAGCKRASVHGRHPRSHGAATLRLGCPGEARVRKTCAK